MDCLWGALLFYYTCGEVMAQLQTTFSLKTNSAYKPFDELCSWNMDRSTVTNNRGKVRAGCCWLGHKWSTVISGYKEGKAKSNIHSYRKVDKHTRPLLGTLCTDPDPQLSSNAIKAHQAVGDMRMQEWGYSTRVPIHSKLIYIDDDKNYI